MYNVVYYKKIMVSCENSESEPVIKRAKKSEYFLVWDTVKFLFSIFFCVFLFVLSVYCTLCVYDDVYCLAWDTVKFLIL